MSVRIAVLGAGSWGTALAEMQVRAGNEVCLWDTDQAVLETVRRKRENTRYHPGFRLSPRIVPDPDFDRAVAGVDCVTVAVPSHAVRATMERIRQKAPPGALLVLASKGLDPKIDRTFSAVAEEVFGKEEARRRYAMLGGPSFAKEVIHGVPTAITAASRNPETAARVQSLCQNGTFRIFLSDDVVGVEIGGALKNVVAIATGASDALGYGHNTRAALLTRALADISRIGQKLGANPLTFAGLAGLGDLILTCTSDLSRNRQVGTKLVQGKSIRVILREIGQTAEGIRTAKTAHKLARQLDVETPILREMYLTLYERKPPREAVADLLALVPKGERD